MQFVQLTHPTHPVHPSQSWQLMLPLSEASVAVFLYFLAEASAQPSGMAASRSNDINGMISFFITHIVYCEY
jgi:hypothetical protein